MGQIMEMKLILLNQDLIAEHDILWGMSTEYDNLDKSCKF